MVQISGSQFSRIHYDQPNSKTVKYIKGPVDFLNCSSDELQSRCETAGPKIAEYLIQVESKILKGTNQNDTHNHEHNPTHNAMLREDYTTVVGRLPPIIKVETDITLSEKLRAFVDSTPELGQQQYEEFVDTRLFMCNKIVSDTVTRNNFVTSAT